MRKAYQTFLAEAGESGCYALVIVKFSKDQRGKGLGDPVTLLEQAINRGWISYNDSDPNDNNNFYVTKASEFLSYLMGEPWEIFHAKSDYKCAPGEFVLAERWERVHTGVTTAHFKAPNWDPLFDSQTVKYGKIVSLRIARRKV